MGLLWKGTHSHKNIHIRSGGEIDVKSGASLKLAGTALTPTAANLNTQIRVASVEISSAEILALFTTAKELVAAPGAGNVLEFVSLLLAYDYNTTAYTVTSATDLAVKITDKTGASVSTTRAVTGFIDQTADKLFILDKLEASVAPVVNSPLCLALAGANPTLGDGVIHAKVCYIVHDTGL